jgi:hypothetical protein
LTFPLPVGRHDPAHRYFTTQSASIGCRCGGGGRPCAADRLERVHPDGFPVPGNLDANERHYGVVAAIALEAIVKLVALIAVGVFVVYGVAGGVGKIFADVPAEVIYGGGDICGPRWVALIFLSATAIVCLPRQFQVTVVENVDERHLATASWLFPLFLFGSACSSCRSPSLG